MLEECPHCYSRVFASEAGECPSCRKNIKDPNGTDPNRTALSIAEGRSLPPNCCDCDLPTDRQVRVKSEIPGHPGSHLKTWTYVLLVPLLGFWAVLMALFAGKDDGRRGRSGETFIVHMPQCKACGATRRPQPIRIDREHGLLTFVVHVNFKKRVTLT